MSPSTTKYLAVARITGISSLMYRGDILMRCATMGMVLFVFVQLWTTTFDLGGFRAIVGFTLPAILWYLVVTETSTHTAGGGTLVQRIGEEVKSGDLARVLIRPYNYVAYEFAVFWGELALRLPVQATLAAAVVWVAVGPPPTTGAAALIAFGSVALSLTINFLASMGIGLLAFWFEEPLPFYWVYQKLLFTIGGLFIPLELLPEWLAEIAARLPFASVAYTPGRLFLGASPEGMLQALSLQVFWVAALACAVALLYARGLRKLSIHGG